MVFDGYPGGAGFAERAFTAFEEWVRATRDAVLAARIGGRVVLVGIPDGDTYTLPASEARRRGLKIKFSRRMGEVYPRAIALVAAGKVDVATLVTHEVGLEEAPEAFRRHAENAPGVVKSLIYPTR